MITSILHAGIFYLCFIWAGIYYLPLRMYRELLLRAGRMTSVEAANTVKDRPFYRLPFLWMDHRSLALLLAVKKFTAREDFIVDEARVDRVLNPRIAYRYCKAFAMGHVPWLVDEMLRVGDLTYPEYLCIRAQTSEFMDCVEIASLQALQILNGGEHDLTTSS